jgi:hypothetical protein
MYFIILFEFELLGFFAIFTCVNFLKKLKIADIFLQEEDVWAPGQLDPCQGPCTRTQGKIWPISGALYPVSSSNLAYVWVFYLYLYLNLFKYFSSKKKIMEYKSSWERYT